MFPTDAFILKASKKTNLKVSNFLIFFYGTKNSNEEFLLEDLGRQNQSQSPGAMLSLFAFAPVNNQTGICWYLNLPHPSQFTVKEIPDVGTKLIL